MSIKATTLKARRRLNSFQYPSGEWRSPLGSGVDEGKSLFRKNSDTGGTSAFKRTVLVLTIPIDRTNHHA